MSAYDPFADETERVSIGHIQMRIGYVAHCLGIPADTLAGLRSGKLVAINRQALHDAVCDLSEHTEPYGRMAIENAYRKIQAMLAAAPAPKGGEGG